MRQNQLTYSKDGLALTELYEGCRLEAYQDIRGVWTIGYGHTGGDVCSGCTISQQQAVALLAGDVASAGDCVNACVEVQVTQCEFDALTDFVFKPWPGRVSRLHNAEGIEHRQLCRGCPAVSTPGIIAGARCARTCCDGGKTRPGCLPVRPRQRLLRLH